MSFYCLSKGKIVFELIFGSNPFTIFIPGKSYDMCTTITKFQFNMLYLNTSFILAAITLPIPLIAIKSSIVNVYNSLSSKLSVISLPLPSLIPGIQHIIDNGISFLLAAVILGLYVLLYSITSLSSSLATNRLTNIQKF